MNELKPCPFCGELNVNINDEAVNDGLFTLAWITCNKCDAQGPLVEGDDRDEAWEEAINLWNQRVDRSEGE